MFGAVTLTKNADIDMSGYSGYNLDLIEDQAIHPRWWIWSKCINFWSIYEFFCNIDNKKNDILVLGKVPTQGLEDTLTAGKMHSINFALTK